LQEKKFFKFEAGLGGKEIFSIIRKMNLLKSGVDR